MHQKQFPKDQNAKTKLDNLKATPAAQTSVDNPAATPEQQQETMQAAMPDRFIGTTIAQRYEILSLAGKGGMSSVYRARHVLTQRIVALKLMHPHLLTDENAVRRFQQEAKAASRLHHINAISVLDMGVTEDDQPFLTMDFLEGRSLSEEIRDCGQIEPIRCIHIFLQVCSALAHAHDQRIVHRDLKPSNVMLMQADDDPDFVKVVDFGIAKILREGSESLKLTATGDVFGSPYYMSPEQCMGNPLDARSDIYSMGCLMYEALTGRVPHEGKNVLETMYMHTNLATPALTDIEADPRLKLRLDQILQKCMAKVPDQRYQSMIELRDDLMTLSDAPQKGFKIAAQLGINAADKGRKLDNKLAALSSKKLFWIATPLLAVLGAIVISFGYYWLSTSGDPSPADRELLPIRNLSGNEIAEKMVDTAAAQCKSSDEVLKKSLKVLGDTEQAHDRNIILYNSLLKSKKTYSPEEFYQTVQRYGFYFMKAGDYGEAIDAFETAINTSVAGKFALPLENAGLKAAIVECLMSSGDGTKLDVNFSDSTSASVKAYNIALEANYGFHEYNVNSTPLAVTNLGNLLELSALSPERLKGGIGTFQVLHGLRDIPPGLKAKAYYQAAQFLLSCEANGIKQIPIPVWNNQLQRAVIENSPTAALTAEMLDGSLKAWEQLERKRTIKRAVFYNEGVIHNRLGLIAFKEGDLELAAAEFNQALQKFVDDNDSEAAAKVLFNLSDVRLKQHNLPAYYETHRDAKRIWDGLLHPLNLSQFKTS
ncbi:MAG: serine/threonine-protein kinase [Candidatus Obscuribacterales bacterium]